MVIQVNQALCAGCGACIDACATGAIHLVDQQAEIDRTLCTQCEACIEACPNGAITALPAPALKASDLTLPEAEPMIHPVLPPATLKVVEHSIQTVPTPTTIKVATAPTRGRSPLIEAALAFLSSDLAPRLVDVLITALERRVMQPTSTTNAPTTISSQNFTRRNRRSGRRARYRGRYTGRNRNERR
jgi:Fe-S-cluster-containing hydrogenase component 2